MSKEMITMIITLIVAVVLLIDSLIKLIKNGWVNKLIDTTKTACAEAEQKFSNGSDKKQYVLAAVEAACSNMHIPFKLIKTLIDKLIEQIVEYYNAIKKHGN